MTTKKRVQAFMRTWGMAGPEGDKRSLGEAFCSEFNITDPKLSTEKDNTKTMDTINNLYVK